MINHDDLPEDYPIVCLEGFSRRALQNRAKLCEHIGDSSKIARAIEELETVEGYFQEIIAVLRGSNNQARGAAGFRLFGCVGLLTLATCDVAVRVSGRKQVALAAQRLQLLRDDARQLARELMAGSGDFGGVIVAEQEERRAQYLADALEDWENHRAK